MLIGACRAFGASGESAHGYTLNGATQQGEEEHLRIHYVHYTVGLKALNG